LRVCGEGALNELAELTTTVWTDGVVTDVPLTESDSPDGLDANVRPTVFGFNWTLAVFVRPPESVAVSCSSRCDGY
jgi:hypothetical protein